MVLIEDIIKAQERLHGIVHKTPLDYSKTFSELSNSEVYLKLENLQKTGSFKVRGSYYKMTTLTEEEHQKGVIAASAGNHAQGVAYSSQMLGVPCTIVMPKGAPLSKIQATKKYGANVELQGDAFDDALAYAIDLKDTTGATFVHTFDDEAIIAGHGTVGLEIMDQIPDVDAIICPVGGGGLIAGIALAVKEKKPSVQIYGVEATACPSMTQSLKEGKPVTVNADPTMADGIAVKRPGDLNFQLVQRYVDDLFCVDEMEMARTILKLLERNKLLVEGSGASSLAAVLNEKLPLSMKNKKVVAVLSGGNVDVNFLSSIIKRGMVEAGRFVRFHTILKNRPGYLEKVVNVITELHGNIIEISVNDIGEYIFPGYAQLSISLETRDEHHIEAIFKALEQKGYVAEVNK